MKRNITVTSLSVTLKQDMDTQSESKFVLMNFGPVRANLTTLQTTPDPLLMELLNSLENSLRNLQSKSYTGYDISKKGMRTLRALPSITPIEKDGIK